MSVEIQVTQADIDNMAQKLDEFAAVLNDRERALLLGVLGMAGKSIRNLVEAPPKQPASHSSKPTQSLAGGFRSAFSNGVGTKFRVYDPAEAEAVSVKGSVDGDWSR